MDESPSSLSRFTGMRLNIELGSPLNIRIENFNQPFSGNLIGLNPHEYLLVRTAIPQEFESGIQPGVTFHVNYKSLGSEYGFESTVIDVIETPFRLTFLSYPDKVKSLDTRIRSRVCCYIPASAKLDGNTIKGTVTDISTGGCRFMIRLPVNLMPRQVLLIDEMSLTFPVMGLKGIQTFYGMVRNTTIDREKIALGIEFIDLKDPLFSNIDEYIRNVTEMSLGSHPPQIT